MQSMTLDNLE